MKHSKLEEEARQGHTAEAPKARLSYQTCFVTHRFSHFIQCILFFLSTKLNYNHHILTLILHKINGLSWCRTLQENNIILKKREKKNLSVSLFCIDSSKYPFTSSLYNFHQQKLKEKLSNQSMCIKKILSQPYQFFISFNTKSGEIITKRQKHPTNICKGILTN